ncbi:pyocin knob domain-containing protein [Lactobacillus helveticus]|uniref:pyocin knob domain-containing protein n=1 Tax=Lactobacillus helveticus TaxID=1587 RepID=UPI0021AC0E99|nr:pyocin knob domain-containing protein [Lactobacillus helveticus]
MVEDSKFSNTILTNIGHQMLTSISNGNKKITYTKAEAYAQDVSSISNETLQALTSLQGKKLSANLLVSNDSGNVVTITANFRNKGLTNDVVFNSIGWFAKLDTDDAERGITANQEYLIGITPASGTQTLVAPPADQSSSQAISINLNMTLSDASNVNMTVNDAGAVHFNQLDDQLAKYTTTADLTKLLAGKADLGLSYTKAEIDAKLLDLTTDTDGKVSADQVQALISDKANISDVYTKSQVDSALSTRDAQISDKANISDVYTKNQVDSALSTRDTQISTKANISDVYTKSDVDNAFTDVRGRLGKLEGAQTLDSPDFNSITSTGVYYITNNTPANIKNNPTIQWGVLVVSNGNGNRTSQVYYPDDGSPQWCRLLNGSNWLPWYQLSTKKDVSNAIDLANQARTTANTKANASDLSALQNSAMQVIDGNSGDDILSFRDEKIRCYNNAQNVKNLPGMSNISRFYVITHTKNGWGNVTVISQDNCYWQNVLNGSNWSGWVKHATSVDITDLQNQINANDNGTITTGYDWNTATPTNQSRTLQNAWIVDQSALRGAVDRMNSINSNANGRLSLGGGNMNLRSTINWNGGEINDKTGNLGGLNWAGGSDWAKIYGDQDDNDNLDLAIDLGDDGSNHVSFRKNGSETSAITSDGHFTGTVDWGHVNGRPQDQVDRVNTITPLFRQIQNSNNWNDIFGVDNPNNVLTSIRIDAGGSGALLNNFAAGIGFGGADTKGVLSVSYGDHQARITGGNGTGPVWSEDIAWKSDVNDLRNQVQQLIDNQFEVQTFTDATAAANWEAQRQGKRMAIVNS